MTDIGNDLNKPFQQEVTMLTLLAMIPQWIEMI